MSRITLVTAAFLLLAAPAFAGPRGCLKPESFANEIYNCGENDVAVVAGKQCSDTMKAEARVQGAALNAVLTALRPKLKDAQNFSMSDTASRLQLAIAQFSKQIVRMQAQARLVASYTNVMIDFADGTDDNSSAECFSKNFHKLQDVADGMTDEILKAKAAREAALKMLATVRDRDVKLDADAATSLGSPTVGATGRVPASDWKPRKGKDYRPSDITGTEKLKKQKGLK